MPLMNRLRDQRGFTTVTVMGVLLVGGLLVGASFAAVNPDISLSRQDQDTKQAYGAAESGLQWYLNRLGQDNNFYVHCTNVPRPNATEYAPVNQRWNGSGGDPRLWRNLPDDQAKYSVELMPAGGYSNCIENDQYSMIDPSGNMRLRVSGRSRGETRTVLATLRRRNFIDFIYFTHFETSDPATYANATESARAEIECSKFRSDRTSFCSEIQFAPTDTVKGPLHSNDSIRVCNSPTFGRNRRDSIELNGSSPGYVASSGCSANPTFTGTLVYPAGQLEMPPSNTQIASIAQSAYHFTGRTEITLNGTTMSVKTYLPSVQTRTMDLPPNGVIYVHNSSCATGFQRSQSYALNTGCGDVWVKGSYGRDLTIAADNDIVINGDLTHANDGLLLGLIANNFVRIYHPVTFNTSGPGGCTNKADALSGPTIQAAILALRHSFIVDNWHCGAPLGDLNVDGAIAQRFRGPVGTGNSTSIVTGYRKEYEYDDRLRYREPPYFLDPVQASWRIARETEQAKAVK